jgi:hypothetical protein
MIPAYEMLRQEGVLSACPAAALRVLRERAIGVLFMGDNPADTVDISFWEVGHPRGAWIPERGTGCLV